MRLLIDGYNLMHALGLMGERFGPDRFRRVRQRFLNDLSSGLDPVDAHQTTVVFDASTPPANLPSEARHKGLTVIFAVDDESADDRLERLIAAHTSPKGLTVVSSDHRIQQAARRRKSRVVACDDFIAECEARKKRPPKPSVVPPAASAERRPPASTPAEAEEWLRVFGDLEADPALREAFGEPKSFLSAEEIDRIQREVDAEFP